MDINFVKCLGSVYPHPDHIGSSGRGAVYDSNGIAPTILTMCGGGNHPFIIVDDFYENSSPRYLYFPCAMRGRNPDNPSDRTPGIYLEQRLEPSFDGVANALTTVQKDSFVLELELTD